MKTFVCRKTFKIWRNRQKILKGQVFMVSDPLELPMPPDDEQASTQYINEFWFEEVRDGRPNYRSTN